MGRSESINVGIIGTGVGLRTHLPGFQRTGRAHIIGIVGSNQERAEEFARKYGIPNAFDNYQQICKLAEVDLIVVATPNNRHYEEVLYALSQNKHVLAEKPLAMTIEEHLALCTAAKSSYKLAVIDHQLRFNPYIQKVRDLIQSGTLGRLYFVRLHQQSTGFSNKDASWIWSFDEELGGGVRLAMASHLIDLLWFWFGFRKIYYIKGAMDAVIPQRKDKSGKTRIISTSSFFSASIAMEDNLDIQLSATAAAFGESRFDFSIYGTDGEIHFDLANKLTGSFTTNRGKVVSISVDGVTPEELENKVSIFSGSFVYFAPKIVDAILSNNFEAIRGATTFEEAIPTQRLLDAIKESTLTGQLISLDSGYIPGARI